MERARQRQREGGREQQREYSSHILNILKLELTESCKATYSCYIFLLCSRNFGYCNLLWYSLLFLLYLTPSTFIYLKKELSINGFVFNKKNTIFKLINFQEVPNIISKVSSSNTKLINTCMSIHSINIY